MTYVLLEMLCYSNSIIGRRVGDKSALRFNYSTT